MPPRSAPSVSILMAVRNVGAYIGDAVVSVQAQTLDDFELLIVDDGSTDDTLDRAQAMARTDARLRILSGPGLGPAAARNLALAQAKGQWLAVVDGDDLLAPDRLLSMVNAGQTESADLVVDNLVAFYDDGRAEHAWLTGPDWSKPRVVTLDDYLETQEGAAQQNPLGYLKPLFRHDFVRRSGLVYDEALFIGEDYDLVARALVAGARFHYIPNHGYRYRRHAASISYRITSTRLEAMAQGLQRLRAVLPEPYRIQLDARLKTVNADLRFSRQVEDLKRGRLDTVFEALSDRESRERLFKAVSEGLHRRLT